MLVNILQQQRKRQTERTVLITMNSIYIKKKNKNKKIKSLTVNSDFRMKKKMFY